MRSRPYFPLLAKVLVWLLLHLVLITLAFLGFMSWQLGLGLDSLISGSAGDRLRSFGESARAEISNLPPAEWDAAIKPLAEKKGVVAGFHEPANGSAFSSGIPGNVIEKLKNSVPKRPRGPGRRPPPPVDGDWPHGRGLDRGRVFPAGEPPESRAPEDEPPPSRPVFLVRGDGGDGYWAGVQIFLPRSPAQPPHPVFLLIRSDRMDGSGMFFEIKPWLVGGLAVLALSLAFWTPFVWQITRYINRLTIATELIAAGNFQISLPPRGNDELGSLGNAVKTMAERLDHLITGQKRFLGDAAHELCAPLARLRTGIGILEMALGASQQVRLSQIEEEAQELATLIEEILAFSRAENRQPSLEVVEIGKLVEEVIIREANVVTIERKIPTSVKVTGDPSLLARAIGNLLRNVEIHAGADSTVVVSAEQHLGYVDLLVSDDGPGVPTGELGRLFEPFYRPDRSRTRATGGSGLGLAIVSSAVSACNGEVFASLNPDGGLCITLRLKSV